MVVFTISDSSDGEFVYSFHDTSTGKHGNLLVGITLFIDSISKFYEIYSTNNTTLTVMNDRGLFLNHATGDFELIKQNKVEDYQLKLGKKNA